MPLQVHTVVSQPFEENTYVVWLDGRRDALVIDPKPTLGRACG